jgi:aminoglycoside 6-adenylyltransferase
MKMRTEAEMMSLIMTTAVNDPRVRAVIMNGSRANPNAPKDIFQDYDIVYVVTDIDTFTRSHNWIDIFGSRIILQMPENMRDPAGDGRFVYLMLLADGNRIDLQLIPVEKRVQLIENDSESILLLDKDGIIQPFPPAGDIDYLIKQPSEKEFFSCCNDFWWCLQNIAKGIWRDELPYAMFMLNVIVRDELHSMIEWYIGTKTEFSVSSGKCGKYFKKYLSSEMWADYTATYTDADYNNMWSSVFNACNLFKETAEAVAAHFGYYYSIDDELMMLEYLRHIRDLPSNAAEIY